MGTGKAEQLGSHLAVQREGASGTCGRAQRVLVGYLIGGEDKLHVVGQRLGIGAEPEPERRGHGHLQMRIGRHQFVAVLLRQRLQAVEQLAHGLRQMLQLIAEEELQVDEHLVVARPAGMYFFAHIAQPGREHELNL